MKYLLLLFTYILLFNKSIQGQLVDESLKSEYAELFKAIPPIDDSTPQWAKTMYNEPLNLKRSIVLILRITEKMS